MPKEVNPFGTNRQDVGGENYRYEPQRLKRWGIVPFRPCRPPTPAWILDWPLETGREIPAGALMFSACRDAVSSEQLGNPGNLPELAIPILPGPLSAPGAGVAAGVSAAQRTWSGRIRQAGAGLRTISYSPTYTGPSIITDIIWNLVFGSVSPLSDAFMFGVSSNIGSGTQFKQARANVPIPSGSIPFFDTVYLSDNEQPGAQDGLLSQPELLGGGGPARVALGISVPWTSFNLWAMFDSATGNAGGLDWLITFQPQTVTIGGSSIQSGANQFNQGTYLGGTRPGF